MLLENYFVLKEEKKKPSYNKTPLARAFLCHEMRGLVSMEWEGIVLPNYTVYILDMFCGIQL